MNSFGVSFQVRFFGLLIALFCFFNGMSQTRTLISDIDDYKDAINAAKPGDTLVLKNGIHDGNGMTITANGEENNPLVIMSESISGAELTGDTKFVLDGTHHVVIHGFKFTNSGTAVKLEGCNNIRITRNIFDLNEESSTKWVFIGGVWDQPEVLSHHNRIDHNTFQNKSEGGHYITVDGSDGKFQSQFDLIDHNLFRNNTPRFSNEKESIRIGWSEMSESSGFTTVEFNYFEDCNGDPEIISVKSCDNVVRHNTITKSEGTISLRHGNRNRVEGNYFFGGGEDCTTDEIGTHCTGGIRIYGEDHVIINNYLEGLKGDTWDAPIALTEGDAEAGNSALSKHFRIERAIIAYNTLVSNDHGIEIGYDNNGKYSKPPRDVVIAYNLVTGDQNELVKFFNQPDDMVWKNNVFYPTGAAVITQDASQTFTSDEILEVNPNLTFDNESGLWKSTENTPQFSPDNSLTGDVLEDVEGQSRGESNTVGADQYSLESIRYQPLTIADVGPSSYHPDYDDEVEVDHLILSVSSLDFEESASSQSVTINSNMDWTATSDQTWLTLNSTSGSKNGNISISVTANEVAEIRSGTVTFSAGEINVPLTVSQAPKGLGGEKLVVAKVTASEEQNEPGKENIKENTIDGDLDSRWSAEGEQFITFELEGNPAVSYLKIAFYKGDERQTHYQIDVSSDNINFTNVVAKTLSSGLTADFETINFEDINAKYVKLTGFGNTGGSDWNSISEVEVWGSSVEIVLTVDDSQRLKLYPNPVENFITIESSIMPLGYSIVDLSGKEIKNKKMKGKLVDMSGINAGIYIIEFHWSSYRERFKIIKE